jgi:hypothetical protein
MIADSALIMIIAVSALIIAIGRGLSQRFGFGATMLHVAWCTTGVWWVARRSILRILAVFFMFRDIFMTLDWNSVS